MRRAISSSSSAGVVAVASACGSRSAIDRCRARARAVRPRGPRTTTRSPAAALHVGDIGAVDPRMAALRAAPRRGRTTTVGSCDVDVSSNVRRGSRTSNVDAIVQLLPVRIAIGADHAGFLLKEHLKATLQRLGHTVDDHGTHSEESVDYPPICLAVGARGRRRTRRARHRPRRQRPGRADRRQQGRRHPRGAVQRSLHRAVVARAQRRQRALDGRAHRRPSASPTKSSTLWLKTPFEGGRHQRRIDQIAATGTTKRDMPTDNSPNVAMLADARRDRSRDRRRRIQRRARSARTTASS